MKAIFASQRVEFMEMLFKVGLSLVATCGWLFFLRWVWTHQLDVPGTVNRIAEKAVAPPEWVATREPDKIYQGGVPIGDVSGVVEQRDGKIRFAQLSNAGDLKMDQPFEYQRLRLRITQIDSIIGMKSDGIKTLTGVREGVLCEILK